MSAENDKALVRRFFEEVWNQNSVEAAKQIVHDNYSSIENVDFPSAPGPQIVADEMKLYGSLYAGLSFKIERMFAPTRSNPRTRATSGMMCSPGSPPPASISLSRVRSISSGGM